MKLIKRLLFLFLCVASLIFFLSQCEWNKNRKKVDLSGITFEMNTSRYDELFFSVDTSNLKTSLLELRSKDPGFFDAYTIQVMRFGNLSDSNQIDQSLASIDDFLTNPYVRHLFDSVQTHFPSLDAFYDELFLAFKHFKYYYPEKPIPAVHTVITEFSYKAFTIDSTDLVIGLDLYLGENYPYYQSANLNFPGYMIRRFSPEYMTRDAIEVLYTHYYGTDFFEETPALIYAMIENGKKFYFLEQMLPDQNEEIIVGYTKEQISWCYAEEYNIWKYYNEYDLFYTKDFMEHKRHVNDGPMTQGMPDGAPGNIGSWIGWQIVRSYMDHHDDVSLKELLETDANTILVESKYKPQS